MESVLIVGASGILAPAAAELAADGAAVTGIGRVRPMPDDVQHMAVDSTELLALDAALGSRRWGSAIVYEPAVTAHALRRIVASVEGRVVLVRTSDAADPALGDIESGGAVLQLGWHAADGVTRWHTPHEVSDAALAVWADGEFRVLGVVRPWGQRP